MKMSGLWKILLPALVLAILPLAGIGAQEPADEREHSFLASLALEGNLENDLQGIDANVRVDYRYEYFSLLMDMSIITDRKYEGSHQALPFMYAFINSGGIGFDFGSTEGAGRLTLRAGRLGFDDVIDSPYSLFVSDQQYPPLMAELSYAHSYFFLTTRGINLTYDSAEGYPTRGANFKNYGIDLKNGIRFGIQEATIYTGIPFDPEYFLSPIPMFYTQYVNRGTGKPWGRADNNDNYLLGLFGEYRSDSLDLTAQLLVDDLSTYGDNPDKVAWNLGGRYRKPYGDFGLYHAGATKYTFQAFGNTGGVDLEYEYTYYPAATFTLNGEQATIYPEDNYLGYRNGENNLAFIADYRGQAWGVELSGALEYVLTGEQSPNNPWFDAEDYTEIPGPSTKLLDGAVLEHELQASVAGRRRFGDWELTLSAMLGYVWNDAELVTATDGNDGYFVPQAGNNRLLYSLSLGVRWILGID